VRGDVVRLPAPRRQHGHEQSGERFAVVLQNDSLPLSTLIVAPTSTAARAASFRPEIDLAGEQTRVLIEQTAAVDSSRLGPPVGHISHAELQAIDAALRLVFDLGWTPLGRR
jgi:mRNA interferase MazF